jgi:hypothetical protein
MRYVLKNARQWLLIAAAGIAVGAVSELEGCGKCNDECKRPVVEGSAR